MTKTKIVCTLGPASSSPDTITGLLEAGMSVVRLNFSHGSHEEHAANIQRVRQAARECDRMIPIVADLQGPKIRTGKFEGGEAVTLEDDQRVRLTSRDEPGSADLVPIDYAGLAQEVEPGDQILLSDGGIELRVQRLDGEDVICTVVSGGLLGERKGVNIPGATLKLPSVTEKDKADLRFALAKGVEYVALSFVRRAKDVRLAQHLIEQEGSDAHLIAKLEKPQALEYLDEILEVSDGVMVARGDLGVELSPWNVPVEQKRIIQQAARWRKPVITATQMLESMIHSPSPTRAEASDVANAVFDGSDALMLSGETAVGEHPVRAVEIMSRIIQTAEDAMAGTTQPLAPAATDEFELSDAVAQSSAQLAAQLNAKYLVVYSESGYTARLISKHRPQAIILGLSRHLPVCHRMKLLWGVRAKPIRPIEHIDQLVPATESMLLELGWVEQGDLIILTAGTPFQIAGKTDLIKVHRIGEKSYSEVAG